MRCNTYIHIGKERKKDEMEGMKKELASLKVDKLETVKDKYDRFWKGFLKKKTHLSDPSGSGISVHTHCLDQT